MGVEIADLHSLPIFPSSSTLRSLHPSQQEAVRGHLSLALNQALLLPDTNLAKLSCNSFIASYVRDGALDVLNALIFSERERGLDLSLHDKRIRKNVLRLVQRLSRLPNAGGLAPQDILDVCVLYGPKNSSQVKMLIDAALSSNSNLVKSFETSVVPSFAQVLVSSESGLHKLRKTVYCLICLIRCAPTKLLTVFSHSNDFILTLAKCYDDRLTAIALGYGGFSINHLGDTDDALIWLKCKIHIIDCFHILVMHVLNGVHNNPSQNAEYAFTLIFSLLHLPTSSTQSRSTGVPFDNRTLIADYQDAYSLSSSLASVLANSDDPRQDVLDMTLRSFESENSSRKEGILKILLRSEGVAQGTDVYRKGQSVKGKGKQVECSIDNDKAPDIDIAVSEVLEILPDFDATYVRSLFLLPQYNGDKERIVEALLSGEAPPPGALTETPEFDATETTNASNDPRPTGFASQRVNIFNEQPMDISNVVIGKRAMKNDSFQDRALLDQMKADILRRAAQLSESEDEFEIDDHEKKIQTMTFEDGLDDELDSRINVAGDGEATSDEDEDKETPPTPETILELAYIQNPKVFDRDAETRRSKARATLRARTGWVDEQIEGWRIMLERNPKKNKILQKHEFSGNTKGLSLESHAPAEGLSTGNKRGGRGRGRGGQGRGGGDPAKERAWKDKNKAHQGNHNRKRGHDRKLARGGAIPGPSG